MIELLLAGDIVVPKTCRFSYERYIDPHSQSNIDLMWESPKRLPFILPGNRRALVSVQPATYVPEGFIGIVGVRSTWARLGIISPPSLVDAGWNGYLTMEIFNSNTESIRLDKGDRLFKVAVVSSPWETWLYDGNYQCKVAPKIILPGAEYDHSTKDSHRERVDNELGPTGDRWAGRGGSGSEIRRSILYSGREPWIFGDTRTGDAAGTSNQESGRPSIQYRVATTPLYE